MGMTAISANATYNDRDLNREGPDPRPGAYYVSATDAGRYILLAGPFPTHAAALAKVDAARDIAHELDRKAIWYGYGTCRMDAPSTRVGMFNDRLELDRRDFGPAMTDEMTPVGTQR